MLRLSQYNGVSTSLDLQTKVCITELEAILLSIDNILEIRWIFSHYQHSMWMNIPIDWKISVQEIKTSLKLFNILLTGNPLLQFYHR